MKKDIKKEEQQNVYLTESLPLAAAYKSLGYQIKVERITDFRAVFSLPNSPQIQEIARKFYDKTLMLNPMAYSQAKYQLLLKARGIKEVGR